MEARIQYTQTVGPMSIACGLVMQKIMPKGDGECSFVSSRPTA